MALEIRDPADSSPTTVIASDGAHFNLLPGMSHGFPGGAAFVYNLHVGKSVPPLLDGADQVLVSQRISGRGSPVPKMFGGRHGGLRRSCLALRRKVSLYLPL